MRNDYTEYLMHKDHKYLSKKWNKGKWQYIYDEKLGGRAKRAYQRADIHYEHAVDDDRRRDAYLDNAYGIYRTPKMYGETKESATKKLVSAYREKHISAKILEDAKETRQNAFEKYANTPIYKLDYAVSKGKKLLNKLFGKR